MPTLEGDTVPSLVGGKSRYDWVGGLALVVLALVTYARVWKAGFVWDDNAHLTLNPCIVGPQGFWDIWTTAAARIGPLTTSSLWLQHKLWGLSPWPYHVVNVLMHACAAIALWQVLRALGVGAPWLGAALWELHPVQVESVAWITELKNTQSAFFYLLTVWLFVKWLRSSEVGRCRKLAWYLLALLGCACAMASKSSTVILPVILGLCAWWVQGRWRWRLLPWLLPMAMMSVLSSLLSIKTQNLEAAGAVLSSRGPWERIAIAGDAVGFYAGKLLWAHPLAAVYPRWEVDPSHLRAFLPALVALGLLAILWWGRRGRLRSFFFAYAIFLVSLMPVLGLVDHGFAIYSPVADRFQYLASMAPLALAAVGLGWVRVRAGGWAALVPAGLLILLATASEQRSAVFENTSTLWADTLAQNHTSGMVYHIAGSYKLQQGDVAGALADWRRALELEPRNGEIHHGLADCLLRLGRTEEALEHFRAAAEVWPKVVNTHYNLGYVLSKLGRTREAVEEYDRAIQLLPDATDLLRSLAWVLATCPDERFRDAPRALELSARAARQGKANDPVILRTCAAAQAANGRYAEALKTAELALRQNAGKDASLSAQLIGDCSFYRASAPVRDETLRPRVS